MSDDVPKLGALAAVNLREVWVSEPKGFTPWLAQQENLNVLASELGLDELELVQTEQQVAEFSVDIVARIVGSEDIVVIENQIERTDHRHLGQVITYAAGKEAKAVVWIASEFAEGHRAAIDWLNRMTPEEIGFFGVEIRAVRIGDSLPAPIFNVVSRPNYWARREVREVAAASNPRATENAAFWTAFVPVAEKAGLHRPQCYVPRTENLGYPIFKNTLIDASVKAYISRSGTKRIGAYLRIVSESPSDLSEHDSIFKSFAEEASKVLSAQVQIERADRRAPEVWFTVRRATDPDDQSGWDIAHPWLAHCMAYLRQQFELVIQPLFDSGRTTPAIDE